jgi:hypothetical protein
MSILNYPEFAYFNMANSSINELGNYQVIEACDLELAHLRVYHKNSNPFSYQMRLLVCQELDKEPVVVSDWETFSNETIGQDGANWLGDLTFTFPNYKLKPSIAYAIKLELTNYSRSGDSRYLSVWLDWGFGKSWIAPVGADDSGGSKIALGVRK